MRSASTFGKKALVLLLVCAVTACGVARVGYRNGEYISYWWLNSYIDIEADQSAMVKRNIDTLFAWHHKTQLKDYAQYLTTQQLRIRQHVTKADLLAANEEVRQRLQVLADRALPELAELALALQPQQIVHLEKKFASNNDSFRKDYLKGDLEKRQRFRYKKALQQAEYWFGDFSREQEALIRAASDARPLNNELLMADRMQRQRDLILLLKKIHDQRPATDSTIAMLKEYINRGFFERPGLRPELKTFLDQSKDANAQLEATVINLATAEQKARAIRKAQQWIDDFVELSEAAK